MNCLLQSFPQNRRLGDFLEYSEGRFLAKPKLFTCCDGTFSQFNSEKNGVRFCKAKMNLSCFDHIFDQLTTHPDIGKQILELFLGKPLGNVKKKLWRQTICSEETPEILVSVLHEVFHSGEKVGIFSTSKFAMSFERLPGKIIVFVDTAATDISGLERLEYFIGYAYREMLDVIFIDLTLKQIQTTDFQKKIQKKYVKSIFEHLSSSTLAKLTEICER